MPNAFADVLPQTERKLSLLNLHTDESINTTYRAEGKDQTGKLDTVNKILRDFRTGGVYKIDSNLIDLLHIMHHKTGAKPPFHIISTYRSPKTNAALSKR